MCIFVSKGFKHYCKPPWIGLGNILLSSVYFRIKLLKSLTSLAFIVSTLAWQASSFKLVNVSWMEWQIATSYTCNLIFIFNERLGSEAPLSWEKLQSRSQTVNCPCCWSRNPTALQHNWNVTDNLMYAEMGLTKLCASCFLFFFLPLLNEVTQKYPSYGCNGRNVLGEFLLSPLRKYSGLLFVGTIWSCTVLQIHLIILFPTNTAHWRKYTNKLHYKIE